MSIRRRLCSVLVALLSTAPAVAKDPVVGEPAPDFSVTTFDGKKLTLADFKDQVLVINFWATWCTPCKKELPLLNAYFKIQQVRGLRVLAVTTEDSAPLYKLKPLAAAVFFPMVRSMRGPYHEMSGVPTNYVIDRQGVLRYARAGAFNLDALNATLVPLLQESRVREPTAGAANDSAPGPEPAAAAEQTR